MPGRVLTIQGMCVWLSVDHLWGPVGNTAGHFGTSRRSSRPIWGQLHHIIAQSMAISGHRNWHSCHCPGKYRNQGEKENREGRLTEGILTQIYILLISENKANILCVISENKANILCVILTKGIQSIGWFDKDTPICQCRKPASNLHWVWLKCYGVLKYLIQRLCQEKWP